MTVNELIQTLERQNQVCIDAYWHQRGGKQGFSNPDAWEQRWLDDTAAGWLVANGYLRTNPGYYEHQNGKVAATTRHCDDKQVEPIVFWDEGNATDNGVPTLTVVPA